MEMMEFEKTINDLCLDGSKATKALIRKQLSKEYPPEFVKMLDQTGIVATLKRFFNGNLYFAFISLQSEVKSIYEESYKKQCHIEQYGEKYSRLYELNRSWNEPNPELFMQPDTRQAN